MGCCASAQSVIIPTSSEASDFIPRGFIEPTPKQAISSNEVSKAGHTRESFTKLRDGFSSVTWRNLQVNSCDKSTRVPDDSFHHKSYSDTFTFDTGIVLSYDGLNKRPAMREDIQMDILKAKITLGANPNEIRTHGDRTCLMCAVLANDFGYVKKLVELGVDINKTNPLGETALSLAIETKNCKLTNYLRSKGAADVVLPLE